MNSLNFIGQTVLIVGGSSGLGNGMAQAFRDAGAETYVTGTRKSAADYADEDGRDLRNMHYSCVDFGDRDSVTNWGLSFPALNVLILCQGTSRRNREEFDGDTFRRIVEINLNSVMDCAMRFKPALAAAQGSLILTSSGAAYRALRGMPAYTASKTAIDGLTRALAGTFIKDGIRVNAIMPGFFPTKLATEQIAAEQREQITRQIPIGRAGTPQDIGGAALFLASPLANYVVGHTLVVDGGLLT